MIAVIGILLILIALGVAGYQSLNRSAALRTTHVVLDSARAMQAELDAGGAFSRLEGAASANPAPLYQVGATLDNPGDVNSGTGGRTSAVSNCQNVLRLLRLTPKAKAILDEMPSKTFVNQTSNPPALADAWQNPIIYVPSGGLKGVNLNPDKNGAAQLNNQTIKSPDGRPFWASAGPDGDFSKGDDNVYSYEK